MYMFRVSRVNITVRVLRVLFVETSVLYIDISLMFYVFTSLSS